MKKIFVPVFVKVLLITCFLTLSLEKEIIVLGTSLEKVLDSGPKNLYEPCINPFGPKSDQR